MTGEHPFFIKGRGWTPASALMPGDMLITFDGSPVAVFSAQVEKKEIDVFNFEVDQNHDYFVGNEKVLTHNLSAANLRRKLGIMANPLLAAHHIVSRFGGGRDGQRARDILKSVGVSLESRANGVALPSSVTAHSTMVSGTSSASRRFHWLP